MEPNKNPEAKYLTNIAAPNNTKATPTTVQRTLLEFSGSTKNRMPTIMDINAVINVSHFIFLKRLLM